MSTGSGSARSSARSTARGCCPILVIVDPTDNQRLLRGLDLGINDYLLRPIDRNEMVARVKTQMRRKRFADRLRDNVQMTMEMAITDGLTGLHNRRYLERHLETLVQHAAARATAALAADPRHRSFQDDQRYATATTPATTCCASSPTASAKRCAASISRAGSAARSSSWPCPIPTAPSAVLVGERIRQKIASEPFQVESGAANLT